MKNPLNGCEPGQARRPAPTRYQRGALVLEVMVAGVLLVAGIGGLAAAQIAGLRNVSTADSTSRLVNLHGSIIDRLRLFPDAAARGELNVDRRQSVRLDQIAEQVPLLAKVALQISENNVPGYLRVWCDARPGVSCEVCVGIYASPGGASRLERGTSPANVLCSRQQIG